MKKRRVALFYSQSLLGEGLEGLLRRLADVDILGPWLLQDNALDHLDDPLPDVVVIADEGISSHDPRTQSVARLTSHILEKYIGLPVVQVILDQDQVRIYNSHAVPASSADLIEAIRRPRS